MLKKQNIWIISTVLLLSSSIAATFAQNFLEATNRSGVMVVTQADKVMGQLNDYLEILEDKQASLSLRDILKSEQQNQFLSYKKFLSKNGQLNPAYAYWGRITLYSTQPQPVEYILEIGDRFINFGNVYIQNSDGSFTLKKTGALVNSAQKDLATLHTAKVSLLMSPRQEYNIYIRIYNINQKLPDFNLKLLPRAHFQSLVNQRNLVQGLFHGAVFLAFCVNLFSGLLMQQRLYYYYIGYLVAMSAYFLNYYGILSEYIFGEYPIAYFIVWLISTSSISIFYLLFVKGFIGVFVAQAFWFTLTNVWMGIRIVELIGGICILLFLSNYAMIHLIHQWVGMIESILFFLLLWLIYQTRKNILINFLIAGTFLLYAGQVLSLVSINFVDLGIRGNLFFEFGALFQILVFSVGLIYNHRIALQEKVETQEQLIQKLKEIDKIQGKMTLELERKIAERTEQLARKNRQEKAQRELIHKQLERYKLVSQKMSELNLLKDKFFSILSHDLRTPLNSIQGMLNLLKAKAISAQETEELVSELSEKTEATQDLVDNLLQWAILQKDGYQVHLTDFEIKPLVDKIFTLFSNFAKQKRVHLFNLTPEGMILHADDNMLKLVIRNLVANAIKFSLKEGSVTVSLDQHIAEKQLIFQVKDNGVGISAENIYKLFDAKSHYSTQGTQQERGTGLGLLLCKEFIEKNRGKIWVESALNEGSTFYFSLPIILPPTP